MSAASEVAYRIEFASAAAEAELRGILLETDMDLAGELGGHVVIAKGDEILGGAFLTQTGEEVFHLAVIAVKEEARQAGIGRRLLGALIASPWLHAVNATGPSPEKFTVTTVARGGSAPFYRRHGFTECDLSRLAEPYRGQCLQCPDREACAPVALHYRGRAPHAEYLP